MYVIVFCYSYFHILDFTPLSLNKIALHYRKRNLTKAYLVSNQSDNSLQEATHRLFQRGMAIQFAG